MPHGPKTRKRVTKNRLILSGGFDSPVAAFATVGLGTFTILASHNVNADRWPVSGYAPLATWAANC